MTAPHIVDPSGLLGQALADASPDLMRELLQTMINALLSADARAKGGPFSSAAVDAREHPIAYVTCFTQRLTNDISQVRGFS